MEILDLGFDGNPGEFQTLTKHIISIFLLVKTCSDLSRSTNSAHYCIDILRILVVLQVSLLHKLHWLSLELLLTGCAAKMIGLTIVGDLELGCLIVQNRATNWVSRHNF